MKITIHKRYALLLLLFYGFLFQEQLTQVHSVFGYGDELLAILALPLFFLRTAAGIRQSDGEAAVCIGVFFLCTLVGTLLYGYQELSAVLPDMLLCVKFWLGIYTVRALFAGFDLRCFAGRFFAHIRVLACFLFLMTVVNWLFGLFPAFDVRFGIPSNRLFYAHPAGLASACGFLVIATLALGRQEKCSLIYIVLLALVMCSTLRSKAIAQALLLLAVGLMLNRRKAFSLGQLLWVLPGVIAAGWSQVEYYYLTLADSARAKLLQTGFRVAADHFPWGAGFGTYGSYYSAVYYSPLYEAYGLNGIHGLGKNGTGFICDSFWPMILGQSGYLGLTVYAAGIVLLVKQLKKLRSVDICFYASGICAVGWLLLESAASTAFVHPNGMPVAFWLGLLLAAGETERMAAR